MEAVLPQIYNLVLTKEAAKKVAAPHGHMGVSHQQHLPIGERRELSPEEQARILEAKGKMLPKIFTSLADQPEVDMHSSLLPMLALGAPGGLLGGVLGNAAGRGLGGLFPDKDLGSRLGGKIGGLGGAILGALGGSAIGHYGTQAKNESIEENMRRLPEGATRRDIQADPLYQANAQRAADSSNTHALAAALASSMLARS